MTEKWYYFIFNSLILYHKNGNKQYYFIDIITYHSNDIKEFLTQDEVIIIIITIQMGQKLRYSNKFKCNKCFYSATTKTRAISTKLTNQITGKKYIPRKLFVNRNWNKQQPTDLGSVAWSMVSVNQRLIPWQRIGFDTA